MNLSIGGIRLAVAAERSAMRVGIPAKSERFRVADGDADTDVDIRMTAAWGDLSEPAAGTPLFESGSQWRLFRDGEDYLFRFTAPGMGKHAFREARFNAGFTSGHIVLHADYFNRDETVFPLQYPLDELLMMNFLARGRGVEVHALGLRDHDGRGYLFLGHSGAGKSTSARLWEKEGVLILSEDRIILRNVEGRIWMYDTPWHCEAEPATASRIELTQMFVLCHAPENELVPMAEHEVVANLFARSFVPHYDREALGYSLELLQQVAEVTPCSGLRFVPDASVVEFVRENAR